MSEDKINTPPVYDRLPYSSAFASALVTYRQDLICALGIVCEDFVVHSDDSISEFMATLRLINFISSQVDQVSKFISGYCPAESEE
ncbi:hypothetical protein [Dipodfec virus UOA04_Rod_771]|nr:hypothetical protein [Dipodfec virus UOA04_Rod_771]